jgi:hypothetical protein
MYAKTSALALALALCSACSNDFSPYSKLDRLRVLAVRAEPPTPLPGQDCELTALTFSPDNEPVSHRWSFCPLSALAKDDYRCPFPEAAAQQVFGISPAYDLGTGDEARFTNDFPIEALSGYCASGIDTTGFTQAVECNPGFPVTLVLEVATGTDALRAGFTVRLPASTPPELNSNPTLTSMLLAEQELSAGTTVVTTEADAVLDWTANLAADAIETRTIPTSEGGGGRRLERLTFSWFSDAGSLDQDRTVYIDGETTLEQATRNRWTAPSASQWPASGTVHLSVVARDDRGGVGWLTRAISLVQEP